MSYMPIRREFEKYFTMIDTYEVIKQLYFMLFNKCNRILYIYIYVYPFTQNSLNFRDARGTPCLHLVNETVAKISDKSSILYTFKPTVCSIFIQITIFSKNRNTYLPLSYQIRALYVNKH